MANEVVHVLTQEYEPHRGALDPVFRLATLSHQWRIKIENQKFAARRPLWDQHNSPLSTYEDSYRYAPEGITQSLDRVVQEKGQAVCILFGSDDNPFASYMEAKKRQTGQPHPIIMITVALGDRRTEQEKATDAAQGRFVVAGTIGTEQLYHDLQAQLNTLAADGIIQHNKADVLVSGLVGGWGDIPFVQHAKEIADFFMREQHYFTESQQKELYELYNFFAGLSSAEKRTLGSLYVSWLVTQAKSLLHSHAYTVFGEVPIGLDDHLRADIPAQYTDDTTIAVFHRNFNTFYARRMAA